MRAFARVPSRSRRKSARARVALALSLLLGVCAAQAQTTPATRQLATQVCAACHGVDGNSLRPGVPSLAGQYGAYLERQLRLFHDQGQRRASGVMGAIAVHLSDAQMHELAGYFSHQPLRPSSGPRAATLAAGESIWFDGIADKGVSACASCHGLRAKGLSDAFPRLAGQHADYVVAQLREFRSGARSSDPERLMRDLAARLSDAEMDAVAQYVARLE